ncbi:DUF4236 domain-containing protein [Pseudoduganella sp. FT26W]|uniref:DUF4236 domain-containing protein n=1 Tax=Duganella aquatilis TaxID=2666082 RepID=A0A844D439_9BURK|nr:DUF4236 domain-containing protein [Duganella aquatilis]MRW87857.1 DUF4236 domain-containing protein [Duganella aquatilis]
MGLSFRKTIKAGPFNFNLSGSGIGVSVGIPGFRVGTGPRGNYISMAGGRFTYRKDSTNYPKAGETASLQVPRSDAEPRPGERFIPSGSATVAPLEVIQSADVSHLSDADSVDIVEEINSKRSKMAIWYWPLIFIGMLWYLLREDSPSSPIMTGVLLALSIMVAVGTFWLYMWDEARRSTVLFYDFDSGAEHVYEQVLSSFAGLYQCKASWRVLASGQVLDGRYNAGAGRTLQRKTAVLGKGGISHLQCNIDVPWLNAGRNSLYFYPDRVFIVSGSRVAACTYGSLNSTARLTRFIEDGGVPSDSNVVGQTWRFVNKNGTPDRRFNNNIQIPIAQYEELCLSSTQGIQECFQFSRTGTAEAFAAALTKLAHYQSNRSQTLAR